MFTGIIEGVGEVLAIDDTDDGRRVRIDPPTNGSSLAVGQSVAIDGVCLTVEALHDDIIEVFLAAETRSRTTVADLTAGDPVNVERAMPAAGRFDGHLVQGHVDTTTTLREIERVGADWRYTFDVPAEHERYIVEKGSITIDGISLTVAARGDDTFEVAIVPTTLERTTLSERETGDAVNIEVDLIAKYVESMLPDQ